MDRVTTTRQQQLVVCHDCTRHQRALAAAENRIRELEEAEERDCDLMRWRADWIDNCVDQVAGAAGPGRRTSVGLIDIPPGRARALLHHLHPDQRPVDPDVVQAMADAIRGGTFPVADSVLRIRGGLVTNGQHRLHACVAAGKPLRTVVLIEAP